MTRVLLLVLLAAVPLIQGRIDRRAALAGGQAGASYQWTGDAVKRMAPGLEAVLADVYWLKTVQHYGQGRLSPDRGFALLGPLIDVTVTLDPRMVIAYRYGAIFLAEPPPGGAGRPNDAIALLARGSEALPGNWGIRQDLGFFHFLFLRDAKAAARILTEASMLPNAPFWLKNLAADVLAKGRERQTALRMWREIRDQSEGVMKYNAEVQISVLEALDQADSLTAAVGRFKERTGHNPRSLEELESGLPTRLAVRDSTGVPFEYDPGTGKVSVSRRSALWRAP